MLVEVEDGNLQNKVIRGLDRPLTEFYAKIMLYFRASIVAVSEHVVLYCQTRLVSITRYYHQLLEGHHKKPCPHWCNVVIVRQVVACRALCLCRALCDTNGINKTASLLLLKFSYFDGTYESYYFYAISCD